MSALRRRFVPARRERAPEHGTVNLIRTLLLFESAMYSAVTPVLPHYAHAFGASKPAVGVLAAAYPAGIIPGSLLGAWMVTRAGVRRTTLVGLLVFAVAIVAFGFGTDIVSLDVLRFIQGAACGFIWGGGLTWVIAVAPRQRRGEVMGSVIAGAIFGTLLGPVLGTLAVGIGTELVFSLVGAVSLGLAVWTFGHPEPPPAESSRTATPLRALIANPRIMLGSWLILLEACTIGATGTLLPLRLSRFGASGVAIGVTFLLTALASTVLATPIGRLVDRRGAGVPLYAGLTMTAVLLALLPLPQSALVLAVVSVVALGGPLTAYTIPAMSVITEAAERAGIALAVATMALNLAWATGETIGAPVAASLSQATSDAVPLLLLAAIMVLTLIPVRRARLTRPATAVPPSDAQDMEVEASERVPVATG
ncbi:MAG TPA: MFS transporter [Solirubrobacteraceae bacterium]|jgi:predicted MFS family arabinose efflux permease